MATTPAPTEAIDVRSLAQIYKSGDLMLQNPAESCVIFVSVILISALLEFVLGRVGNIENKYVRLMAETMTQEITIVGVLALILMFGTSVLPKDDLQDRYVTLFTWANMGLFFMAVFFVSVIMVQFAIALFDLSRWRLFEEGRMDSEEIENLGFREKIYKLCFDKYKIALKLAFEMNTSEIPFFEFLGHMLRQYLVKFSDLSYRTWLSLSFVVIVNLLRTKLTPFLDESENSTFANAGMFVSCVGGGIMLIYGMFVALLQRRVNMFTTDRIPTRLSDAGSLVPLGTPKRGIEFLQSICMSTNWYMTLFITGVAKDISTLNQWQMAIIFTSFAIPILLVYILLPWCILMITLLGTIENSATNKELVDKLVRRIRGDLEDSDDEDDDDESDEDDEPVPLPHKSTASTSASVEPNNKYLAVPTREGEKHVARPTWLEDDDFWDGQVTSAEPLQIVRDDRMGHLYYQHLDRDEVSKVLQKRNAQALMPHLSSPTNQSFASPSETEMLDRRTTSVSGRPIWLEEGEDFDADFFASATQADAGKRKGNVAPEKKKAAPKKKK